MPAVMSRTRKGRAFGDEQVDIRVRNNKMKEMLANKYMSVESLQHIVLQSMYIIFSSNFFTFELREVLVHFAVLFELYITEPPAQRSAWRPRPSDCRSTIPPPRRERRRGTRSSPLRSQSSWRRPGSSGQCDCPWRRDRS